MHVAVFGLLLHSAVCTSSGDKRSVTVEPGEGMLSALERGGVEKNDRYAFLHATRLLRPLQSPQQGASFELWFDAEGKLHSFEHQPKPAIIYCVERQGDGALRARTVGLRERTRVETVEATLRGSLLESVEAIGEHAALAHLIAALSPKKLREGAHFSLAIEKRSIGGSFTGYGWIREARFTYPNGQSEELHLFEDNGYYTPNGRALTTGTFAHPVRDARLTSGFGLREDPIAGFTTEHLGLDYAAPVGTPVIAARSGVIERIEVEPTLGNVVTIAHPDGASTRYAHLSTFHPGLARGQTIKRGAELGRVGTTGRSTGPHLHFEVWVHGLAIDPRLLLTRRGAALEDPERARFLAQLTERADPGAEPIGSTMEPIGSTFSLGSIAHAEAAP